MPSITNVGGSFTSAIILTLLAWAVRWVRSRASQPPELKAKEEERAQTCGKYFAILSPAAVRMLVETQPVMHLLVDVRKSSATTLSALPADLHKAVRVQVQQLADALLSPAAWTACICGGRQRNDKAGDEDEDTHEPGSGTLQSYPHPETLLVFLTNVQEDARAAAAAAASRGFERTALVAGGLSAWEPDTLPTSVPRLSIPQLRYINRDAVALLFGIVTDNMDGSFASPTMVPPPLNGPVSYITGPRGLPRPPLPPAAGGSQQGRHGGPLLIDLRRHDERALYGSIPGALHLPVDEFPSALELSDPDFFQRYRFAKPALDAIMVFLCRTQRRASWAAVLAQEHGYSRCLVYRQGTYGWRLSSSIKAYDSYEVTDPPPPPQEVALEQVDIVAAKQELQHLRLMH